ncbi:DUF4123 domain-containing protein [Pseudomonas sp.]|uniref:DUF4123 domain-containing protein n=1 Tax=Pseudomonas sp. TaxID=306 RepID=UPI003A9801E3
MHEGLTQFIDRAKDPSQKSPAGSDANVLYFIIDQGRQPDALERLYGIGQSWSPEYLLGNTEYSHLAASGPLWFSAEKGSELAVLGMHLCKEKHAGIIISADDGQRAFAHAQWLIKVNDGSGGQSLATYYLPSFWAALASAVSDTQRAELMGPWHSVYSSVPGYLDSQSDHWLSWHREAPESAQPSIEPPLFSLPQKVMPIYRTLRWVYWIDEVYPAFGSPTEQQLPQVIDNLELLVQQGIYQGRHLVQLPELVSGPAVNGRAEIMAILQSRSEAFVKIEHLKALSAAS